jgi:hypothetical protein
LIRAINAMKAMSMAAMLIARRIPSEAPAAAASTTLAWRRSPEGFTSPNVSGCPVSGTRILLTYSDAGAAMTLVARIATGSAPILM